MIPYWNKIIEYQFDMYVKYMLDLYFLPHMIMGQQDQIAEYLNLWRISNLCKP